MVLACVMVLAVSPCYAWCSKACNVKVPWLIYVRFHQMLELNMLIKINYCKTKSSEFWSITIWHLTWQHQFDEIGAKGDFGVSWTPRAPKILKMRVSGAREPQGAPVAPGALWGPGPWKGTILRPFVPSELKPCVFCKGVSLCFVVLTSLVS